MSTGETAARTRFKALQTEASNRFPGLPFSGFAFWFAWNLLAFSGTAWRTSTEPGDYITYLFIIHLLACVVTNLSFALTARRTADMVMTNRFLALGALMGCAGSALIVVVGKGFVPSLPVFVIGAVLAGVGTSFMLMRSATVYGTVNPHRSLLKMCTSVMIAIATYYLVNGFGEHLAPVVFCLLPASSALMFLAAEPGPEQRRLCSADTRVPPQFVRLLVAIFFYSLTVSVINRYTLTNLPTSLSVACMGYVMFGLMCFAIIVIFLRLMWPGAITVNTIFYPTALILIVGVALVPFVGMALLPSFSDGNIIGAAIIDFAGYAFDILVWLICPYLAFQLQGGCIKFMGLGTATMSAGLVLGSIAALALLDFGIESSGFLVIVGVMGLLSLVMTILVFPDKKLQELLVPVDDDSPETTTSVAERNAAWSQACAQIAGEAGLTEREAEVMVLLGNGATAQQVADELVISVHTARAHIRGIHSKLSISSNKDIRPMIESRIGRGPCTS